MVVDRTHRRTARRLLALGAVLATALAAAPAPAPATPGPAPAAVTTSAEPAWASASTATIRPGVQVVTAGQQCTANFVFHDVGRDSQGREFTREVLLGMAAHCAGTGGSTATDGCTTGSRGLGTPVQIDGASRNGTLFYSAWLSMQARRESNPDACANNDLALVRVDPADWSRVNPSMPFWGGPTGLRTTTTSLGTDVFSYGNSGLRLGLAALSPKQGTSLGTQGGGWTHVVYTATPGIPGDSGSGSLDANGRAFGVTSVIYLAPFTAANGLTDLNRALSYARTATGRDLRLVRGTEPFRPLLP
ncbi:MAG: trypsin-like peptidase domain-containing protein [Actinomycetes bacterium]